jgi:glycosyltransferase involved in cell wall biosynthesis
LQQSEERAGTPGHVVVGIPTFRRPNGLRKLLESLAAPGTRRPFRIVVAENDAELEEGRKVCEALRAGGFAVPLDVVSSKQRGISEARNALVEFALADADCAYLLMLDDDEWVGDGWLDAMVDGLEQTRSDIVGGPVERILAVNDLPDYLREASMIPSKSDRLERIRSVEATSNIGFDMRLLRRFPDERFDPFFSVIGGGDRDYLLRLRLRGATFAWVPAARVYEDFPATRCTEHWTFQRAFRVGNTEMLAYLKNRPPHFMAKEFAKLVLGLGHFVYHHGLLGFSPKHRFLARQSLARTYGKISALFGKRHREYDVIHGS